MSAPMPDEAPVTTAVVGDGRQGIRLTSHRMSVKVDSTSWPTRWPISRSPIWSLSATTTGAHRRGRSGAQPTAHLDVGTVGKHTRKNVAQHADVTVVWPPRESGGYTLIVDGTGDGPPMMRCTDRAHPRRAAPQHADRRRTSHDVTAAANVRSRHGVNAGRVAC